MRIQELGAKYDRKFDGRLPQDGWRIEFGYARRIWRDPVAGKLKTASMHRLIWELEYGLPVPSMLDHINGDRLDNRLENLRAAGRLLNSANLHGDLNGFSENKWGRFESAISFDNKAYHLGTFATAEEAKAIYLKNFQIRLNHLERGLLGVPPFERSLCNRHRVDREVVRLLLAEGLRGRDVAERLGVHRKTIYNCRRELGLPREKSGRKKAPVARNDTCDLSLSDLGLIVLEESA
jgi:hypothetical protein